MSFQIKSVGIVGCGTMGSGIAEIVARAGYDVVVRELDNVALAHGIERITHSLDRALSRSKISQEEYDATLGRIRGTIELNDLANCDLIVEAVPERLEVKRPTFTALDSIAKPDAILATNTSSLPVIEMAVATNRPERVVGLHFFNPAPVMALVELVHTVTTSPEVLAATIAFAESLNKTPIAARDRAGFIANLLLFPYLNEAVRMYESGFASREDIDTAMRLGAGHPMGPLALLDLVGLDSCYQIMESLYRQFSERRFAPAPTMKHLVSAGYLGRKTGRGFYTYEEPSSPTTIADARGGRTRALPSPDVALQTFGIVGTGTMGAGVAEVAAKAGLSVVLRGRSRESLDKALARIDKSLTRMVEKGRLTAEEKSGALDRISPTMSYEDLKECDVVLETLAESLDLKVEVFREIDSVCKPSSVLATCTSSLPVVELAAATSRSSQVCGLHFFNPAPAMKLVEVVSCVGTSDETLGIAKAAAEMMGKTAVVCDDRAGFIVNRLLFPYLNDAITMVESGYATADDIDTAMTTGCAHPMGPLALVDIVGLDVSLEILKSLHAEFREPGYAPAPLLEHMVKAGYTGKKAGRGFKTYA